MGNYASVLTNRGDVVGTNLSDSLEVFQEKVNSIGNATEELKISFSKVLSRTKELEEYLSSLPGKPGDSPSDGQQNSEDCKYRSLDSLTKFSESLSEHKTEARKLVQDFLQLANQQIESLRQTTKDCTSIISLDTLAFPDTDIDEGMETSCQNDKYSLDKGEITDNILKKPLNVEDLLALFYTEETLLKQRDEIRAKRFEERQRHDVELELWAESVKKKQTDIEKELQSKVDMLEKIKEEHEILKKGSTKHSLCKDNENTDWSEMMQKKHEENENHLKDSNNANEVSKTKIRCLEQELQSERRQVASLEIFKEVQDNMKKDNIRIFDQLSQLQSLVKDNVKVEWSNRIEEKEEDIKTIRKDFNEALEHYKSETTYLQQELQSERNKVRNMDKLQQENETLKKDNMRLYNQLKTLQKELSEKSSSHEDERKQWSKVLQEKEDKFEQYRNECNANKEYTNEIAKNIRSLKENVELINKKSTDLKQKESEISNTKEKLKSKKQYLLQEISDLKKALDKADLEKEQIIQRHEEKIRDFERKIATLSETKTKMQDQIDRQKQETLSIKHAKDKKIEKCVQLTRNIQELEKKNESLENKNKEIEKEKTNMEIKLTVESQKAENALERCRSLAKLIEERDTTLRDNANELVKLHIETKQLSTDNQKKTEEIENNKKYLNNKLNEYKTKNTNLKQELESERSRMKIFDKLQQEHEDLKKEKMRLSDQLNKLQNEFTEQSLAHEDERNLLSKRIQEKKDTIDQCRKDLDDAKQEYASEIAENLQVIKVQLDLIHKQNMDLKQKESEISNITGELKNKQGIVLQEISALKTALDKANVEKEYIILQHKEINTANANIIQTFEAKIHDFKREIAQLNKTKQEMQDQIDRQKIETSSLAIANDEKKEKCDQLTSDIQMLNQEYKSLKEKSKDIENEKSNIEIKLKSESQKAENALRRCQVLTKQLEERDQTLIVKSNELEKLHTETKQLSRDCKKKEEEIQNLLQSCKENLEKKELLVQRLEKDIENLHLSLKTDNEKYEDQREHFQKTISNLESDKQKMHAVYEQAVEEYEHKFKTVSDINEKHKASIKECNEKNDFLVQEQKQLIKELNDCKTTLQESENAYRTANHEIKKLRDETKQIELRKEKELERQRHETEKLSTNLKRQLDLNKQRSEELMDAKNQLRKLQEEINELQKLNSKNNENIAELQGKTDKYKTENKELGELYASLLNANKQINSELHQLKAKQTLKIQMYSNNRGDMLNGVEAELMAKLKSSLENDNLKLKFSQCAKKSEIEPNIPTLVLCTTALRLGTDVSNAIQDLTLTNSMALVIFHHKDTHAVPSQASERVLTGSELSGIGGIFDFAFLAATGMHSNCKLNNNNFISLVHFITK